MTAFASGARAKAICDRCGLTYRLGELRGETVMGRNTGVLVCPDCWDCDHPQNFLGLVRVDDPQALRNPRPDTPWLSRDILWGWRPVMGVYAKCEVGQVKVTT